MPLEPLSMKLFAYVLPLNIIDHFRFVIHSQYCLGSGCIVRLRIDAEDQRAHDVGGASRRNGGQHNYRAVVVGREMRNRIWYLLVVRYRRVRTSRGASEIQTVSHGIAIAAIQLERPNSQDAVGAEGRYSIFRGTAGAGALRGNAGKAGVADHLHGQSIRRLAGDLNVSRGNGSPAVAIDKLRAFRQGISVRQHRNRQRQGQNRRQKAQAVRACVHLNVIDRLTVGRTPGDTDRHGREHRVDAGVRRTLIDNYARRVVDGYRRGRRSAGAAATTAAATGSSG